MNKEIEELKNEKGKGIRIVILDSGVRMSHPRLNNCKISGYNINNNSRDIEDYLGHGTAIAGIINQHVPQAEIFMIKIFDHDYTIEFDDLYRALEYINENVNFDILNLSIGVTECFDHKRLENICCCLSQKGIIISAFDNFGAISYPAAYSCVIGVDSNSQYTKPFDYDFVDDMIINIRAKGGNQRLLWSDPDYMIQSGSSFACAHVTGLVAKIMRGHRMRMQDVLAKLRNYATVVFESCTYFDNMPNFKIEKAICFPYNKEIDTLCRNESLLNFELVGIYDSRYSMNLGKTIKSKKKIKNIEKLDWSGDFDTVILGHLSELMKIVKVDYYKYIKELCVKYNKNLFQFDPIKNTKKIYSPNILTKHIPPLNWGKLYMLGKPVIAVLGTSSRQGKFSLQLALRKEFSLYGYTVGQLGTEPQSFLFGFDESFPCGFGTDLNLNEQVAISYINHLLHKIEVKNPDVIIVGGQSGVLPYAMYNIGNNSPYQRELLLAANPDAIILCINYYDDVEYIERSIKYIESLSTSKVIALSMFPFDKAFSWSVVSGNFRPIEESVLEFRMQYIEKKIGIKVFSQLQVKQLCNQIIDYLSEEKK